jgi:hypothetical protein
MKTRREGNAAASVRRGISERGIFKEKLGEKEKQRKCRWE